MTIFLFTWGVYSGNADKAPLVLQVTTLQSQRHEYYYLQKPKMKDDQVIYDHEIWYQNRPGTRIIMLSEIINRNKGKQWVLAEKDDMKETQTSVFGRYDHEGDKPPEYPTKENDSEIWKFSNSNNVNKFEVKLYFPAIAKIKSSEELKKHVDFFVADEKQVKAGINAYVKTKVQEAMKFQSLCHKYSTINVLLNVTTTKKDFDKEILQFKKTWYSNEEVTLPALYQQEVDRITKTFDTRIYWITDFQSLCHKYSTINILLNVTTKKEDFAKELLEFKKTWYSNEEVTLSALYQQEVERITNTFDTRIYWITGITIVLIIIIICIIFCIIFPKQVNTTDDMINNENNIYDEENPAPTPRLSNSEVSDSETECSITPVIFRTVSETVSSQNLFSSEEMIDYPPTEENTKSLQSEEKKEEENVSNEIVTQHETDTDSLFSSEEIVDTDTNEKTDSIKSAEEISVEKSVTEKETTINITKKKKTKEKKYSIKK